jgi:MFS family permease
VLVTTGSATLVGLALAVTLLPSILIGPVAGVYADRTNRRTMMIVSNLFQGVVTAVVSILYLNKSLSFPVLLLSVFILYTGAQFYAAANNAIIPRIVSRANLGAANSLFSLSSSTNLLLSYAVGGLVILAFGSTVPIVYDSLTFFFAAAMLNLVAKTYGEARVVDPSAARAAAPSAFRKEFLEGLSYVRRHKLFLQLIVYGLLVNFFGGATYAILAPYAKLWLRGDASTYGFILSAFYLGTMVGSVSVGKLNFREYVGKLLFFGLICFGLLIALAGLATTVPMALAVFFGMGLFIAVVNIPIQVLVQTQIPTELLGRATTVLRSLLAAAQPVSALIAGSLASVISIGLVFVGFGVAITAVSVLLYLVFVDLRLAKY